MLIALGLIFVAINITNVGWFTYMTTSTLDRNMKKSAIHILWVILLLSCKNEGNQKDRVAIDLEKIEEEQRVLRLIEKTPSNNIATKLLKRFVCNWSAQMV